MNLRFHLKVLAKAFNLSSRKRHWQTAVSFKKHYEQKGYSTGYLKAKDDLKTVIEHSYQEKPDYSINNDHVVLPTKLDFSIDEAKAFYAKVWGTLPKKKRPNEEQQKLIFSQSRNTLSVAGAGSGKTTSLINRLLFLHMHCKVPLEELTVFSFTRASVGDFRKKLIEVFGANGITVSEDKSERIIRTFHSKVLEMSKDAFLKGQFRIFEFLKNKADDDLDDDEEKAYKAAQKKANEEVVAISELNEAQSELLYKALDKCYAEKADFKKAIDRLFLLKLRGDMDDGNEPSLAPSIIKKTNEFDEQLVPIMKGFYQTGKGAIAGRPIGLTKSEYSNLVLTSDAYYPEYGTHVVFAPSFKQLQSRQLSKDLSVGNFSQSTYALARRKAFIAINYSSDDVKVIREQADLTALENFLANSSSEEKSDTRIQCPRFTAKFKGDYEFEALTDVFFKIATFTESIGLSVADCDTNLKQDRSLRATDKLLLGAVRLYWKTFEQVLAQNGVVRFHDMFDSFSTPHNKSFSLLSPKVKRGLSNIIIDEFQDISPEVARWIKATLITLTQEHLNTSLMCVGDDFQSIYGWRGSSPDYLTKYKERFPSKNICYAPMRKNYRSYQSIVDTAESCLQYKKAFNKSGECENSDDTPRLSFREAMSNSKSENAALTKPSINLMVEIVQMLKEEDAKDRDCDLLVMAKTNNALKVLEERYKKTPKSSLVTKTGSQIEIRFETFHRSKGLEARYCLLVEDCHYDNQHPTKNRLYKLARFDKSFDDAQREESMRLAYVAVTRAKEKVWWLALEDAEGGFQTAKTYALENSLAF